MIRTRLEAEKQMLKITGLITIIIFLVDVIICLLGIFVWKNSTIVNILACICGTFFGIFTYNWIADFIRYKRALKRAKEEEAVENKE